MPFRGNLLNRETIDGSEETENLVRSNVANDANDANDRKSSSRTVDAELRQGAVLEGRYELISPLGEGGMGDVWLAHNLSLDIKVALKVLRVEDNHPERKAKLTQRLLQEARAAAKLGHPAIVRITDFGETPSGHGFFVMELLEGEDLYAFLDRHGRLSAVKAVRTLLPIAHALVSIHAKNIVHRDLKPENIFLSRDESGSSVQPKLIDFGVAKLHRAANERITMAGAVLGSPGYMAPEQARGEDVDERADVWGLCVVLYETITGRLPFEGKNYNALMRSIIEDTPPPLTSFGVGDETLATIVARGFAKNPDNRWQSMRELGTALALWLLARNVTEDICGSHLATLWVRERSCDLGRSSSPPPPPSQERSSLETENDILPQRERARAETMAETIAEPIATLGKADSPAHTSPARKRTSTWALLVGALLALSAIGVAVLGVRARGAPTVQTEAPTGIARSEEPRKTTEDQVSPPAVAPSNEGARLTPTAASPSANASPRASATSPQKKTVPAAPKRPSPPKLKNPF